MDLMQYLLQKRMGYINIRTPAVPIIILEFKAELFQINHLVSDITVNG